MSYKVEMTKSASEQLAKINKSNPNMGYRIQFFLDKKLTNDENPCFLPNAKKLQFSNNRWRWRLGDYRIIGIVDKIGNPIIINIIQISHRQEAYKK